ncbi:phage integrase SAM-like domain-containing protein [Microcystis aeruginosa CS-555/01A07]|nr:phage integrase SAM-like domain-containing protein [Microcystis aeruginosa]MDB9428399.1 phage integrase SAM-like domain-containing protein [Microcystis aeruginosa CS-555/01A07]
MTIEQRFAGEKFEMDDSQKYEADCQRIRKVNHELLKDFESWLESSGLSEKTINNHVSNIDFYINEYLLYEDAVEAKDGVDMVGDFLGYWFIKKALWASQSSLKSNAGSLKKFYTFLLEKGLIDKNDLRELKETIKEELSEWLETLE